MHWNMIIVPKKEEQILFEKLPRESKMSATEVEKDI